MNLLTDPLLSVIAHGASTDVDLSTLFVRYVADDVEDLPFLRPHQQAPWHRFCVLLAILALHRAGSDLISNEADVWRELLRGLTPEWPNDEPWRLIVSEPTLPAFMQPPIPKGLPDPHRTIIETADDLDVLVTSRNHGVKQGQAADASPGDWIAALVSLQTTGGYLGAGNFNVARMNGGFATCPCIGLVPPGRLGARWRRDVTVLLRQRDWSFERVDEFAAAGGHALLWCLPWDGARSLDLADLDPWFIEVCRRVRLSHDSQGRIVARTAGSATTRVAAKTRNGNVGDPWIPIDLRKGSAAYNTAPRYPVIAGVLFERKDWIRPLLLDWHRGIDATSMVARFDVVVRGQGTTEGHHVREVPIEGERRLSMLMLEVERDRLAQLAAEMISHARDLRLKILKIPLLTLAQAGADELDFRDRTSNAWIEPFLHRVDGEIEATFFDHLFTRAEGGAEADRTWIVFLQHVGKLILGEAVAVLPIAGARRMKAVAVAEEKWRALFWSAFKGYLDQRDSRNAG